jgi:hypothetical protein
MRIFACASSTAEILSWDCYRCCFFHDFIIAQNMLFSVPPKSEYFLVVYDTHIRRKKDKKIVSTP